jgi:dTDP-4-dehydrorhamnose reductase
VRWLVTGAAGMLGQDAVDRLRAGDHEAVATDRDTLDITDPVAVRAAVAGFDAVLNCAAYTAVDDAEAHEDLAALINATGPAVLASATAAAGVLLVQISTDYVFDGAATEPYREDAPLAPQSAYGRTKAAGERAVRESGGNHLIVRTAWLYGARGPCFPKTIARLALTRDSLSVVDDQIGQPTWTVDVADLVVRLVEAGAPTGTYHATSAGAASKQAFAQAIVAALGKDPVMVAPTTSEAFVLPASRPPYSVLGHAALERIGIEPIGPWQERWALAAPSVLAELNA